MIFISRKMVVGKFFPKLIEVLVLGGKLKEK